jgi:hypothetical protein
LPRRDALRSAHDKVYRSRSSAIAAAPVRHWQRGVILGAVLIGLVLGLVSASWTQLSSPMGVRSADAHSECGEPGLDSELCKLAYQGSLVTLLGY